MPTKHMTAMVVVAFLGGIAFDRLAVSHGDSRDAVAKILEAANRSTTIDAVQWRSPDNRYREGRVIAIQSEAGMREVSGPYRDGDFVQLHVRVNDKPFTAYVEFEGASK